MGNSCSICEHKAERRLRHLPSTVEAADDRQRPVSTYRQRQVESEEKRKMKEKNTLADPQPNKTDRLAAPIQTRAQVGRGPFVQVMVHSVHLHFARTDSAQLSDHASEFVAL